MLIDLLLFLASAQREPVEVVASPSESPAQLSPDHDLPTRRILPPTILHAIERAVVSGPSG
jgi:hypothetical protein